MFAGTLRRALRRAERQDAQTFAAVGLSAVLPGQQAPVLVQDTELPRVEHDLGDDAAGVKVRNRRIVVLMHLGTNDVWSNIPANTILDAYTALLGQMRASKPTIKLVVARIIPMSRPRLPAQAPPRPAVEVVSALRSSSTDQ